MKDFVTIQVIPMFSSILRYRFIKFGCVGVLGMGVNLVILYAGQEYLFVSIATENFRLYVSLGLAIILATFHNYLWNRHWTWAERKDHSSGGFFVQMYKYYLSCTLAIAAQYILTAFFTQWLHYMLANICSIGFAAILTYLVNDSWTFSSKDSEKEVAGLTEIVRE